MTTGAPRQLGPFETGSSASKPDWSKGLSIKKRPRPLPSVTAWASRRGEPLKSSGRCQGNYAMWCSKAALSLANAKRSTPISDRYPLWLAKLATPDSSCARSQLPHSLFRFTSAAWTSFQPRSSNPQAFTETTQKTCAATKTASPKPMGKE